MLGLRCYAILWLAMCAYNSYSLVAPEKRRKRLDEIADSSHIYETMLTAISPRVFTGLFLGMELLMIAFESAGLAMAYAYVPLENYFLWAFALILSAHIMQSVLELVRIKKMSRIFQHGHRAFAVLSRYLRLQLNPSFLTCLATYGKCLVAVQLLLHLFKGD